MIQPKSIQTHNFYDDQSLLTQNLAHVDLCVHPRRGGTMPFAVDMARFRPMSLLSKRVHADRTCAELGIDPRNCNDRPWTHYRTCHNVSQINRFCAVASRQALMGIDYLNYLLYKTNTASEADLCLVQKITKVESQRRTWFVHIYK